MVRPSKYPEEVRERAVRMVAEVAPQCGSRWAAITAVAGKLGVVPRETVRTWVRRAEVDAGNRPGVTTEEAEELKRLKRENAELRRANEILKAAGDFLRGRARPAQETVIRFIAEHKDHQVPDPVPGGVGLVWGVEPLCAELSAHGIKISPSTYYEWINKKPTKQQLRDEEITQVIVQTPGAQQAQRPAGGQEDVDQTPWRRARRGPLHGRAASTEAYPS